MVSAYNGILSHLKNEILACVITWMDFEDIMLSQKASHKMKYTVPFNLDVVPGVVRFTETGHRMVIARGRRRGE